MFHSRRAFTLVTVAVLAVMAWWVLDEEPRQMAGPGDTAPPETDYYLRGFTMLNSDDDGRWTYRLEADHMLHYPASAHWEFEAPRVEVFSEQGANWYGEAQRGRAWNEGDTVLLQGEVRFERPASEHNQAVRLDTSEVQLDTPTQYAETERPSVLRQNGSRLEGIGARAWLQEERIELLSNVRAFYEPETR